MLRSLLRKYRDQLGDSAFSIAGLLLMNLAAQIVLYPFLADRLGEAGYGELQYLMAYLNIFTVTAGTAANLARMTAPSREENSGDYHLFLLAVALLGIPFTLLIRRFAGVAMSNGTYLCYYLLLVAMAFRYYVDVTYKISLSYRRYCLYYAVIGLGYLLGAALFAGTGNWPLAILVGEATGVVFAYATSPILRHRAFSLSPAWRRNVRVVLILCLSEGFANLILNADRLTLKLLIGPGAVTVYYLATLVGKTMSLVTTPLSGVLLGYLARYEGKFTGRMLKALVIGSLASILLFTGLCTGGGYLVLLLLYPAEVSAVAPYLLAGSLAEVLFFVTTVITVVLVRFAHSRCQLYVNGAFGLAFLGIGIPATLRCGIAGFAGAMIAAGALRYLLALLFCAGHTQRSGKPTEGA